MIFNSFSSYVKTSFLVLIMWNKNYNGISDLFIQDMLFNGVDEKVIPWIKFKLTFYKRDVQKTSHLFFSTNDNNNFFYKLRNHDLVKGIMSFFLYVVEIWVSVELVKTNNTTKRE